VKTGAARGRSRTRRRQGCLLPLLQRRHDAVFFLLADEPCRPSSPVHALRPVATKVRTSFPCPLWTPRPSSRGGTRCSHRATAPPPVMPAFEPGWEVFSCRCCCQLHRVRVVTLFRFLVPWAAISCVAAPGHRCGPVSAHSRSCMHPSRLAALARLCTPARAHPSRRGPGRTFGPFSLAPDLATTLHPCSPRRHGLAMKDSLAHMVTGEWSALLGLSRARLTADPCAHPHASVPGRGFHVRHRPFCAGSSSVASYAAPPLCGQLRAQARAARTSTPVHPSARVRTRVRTQHGRPRCRADHGTDLAAPVASFLVRLLQALAIQGDPVKLAMGHDAQAPRDLTGGKAIPCRRSLGT
jgi:hypothetical protein